MKKIAISLGDLNGIGLQIALEAHEEISKICEPIYCINEYMLLQGARLLKAKVPHDFHTIACGKNFRIRPATICKEAGMASFESFLGALNLTKMNYAHALVTLPINKYSWHKANIKYKGHTDALEDLLKQKAMMMLGCDKLFVALFTHHVPLKEVPNLIKHDKLTNFLLNFCKCFARKKIGVLALNPHAGDGGVLGDEEKDIIQAIKNANTILNKEIFIGPLVPDVAFSPKNLADFNVFVAMYHDQGLTPLKTLYFDESINVSLGLSIIRASVDHGTAFDIAYKNQKPKLQSYINAVKYAIGEEHAKHL